MIAGSIADVVGKRLVNLTGSFILGSGFVKAGTQLIVMRALTGVAVSLCLPTAIGILSNAAPNGKMRNLGFACLGLSSPFGFSVGLVLGGVFVDTIGWRFVYYLGGAVTIILFFVGIWILPADIPSGPTTFKRVRTEIDWIGAVIATAWVFSAMFSRKLCIQTAIFS